MALDLATKEILNQINAALKPLRDDLATVKSELAEAKKKALEPAYPAGFDPATHFYRQADGALTKQSGGYSILKAVAFAQGMIEKDNAKTEIEYSAQLKALYTSQHYRQSSYAGYQTILVPHSTAHIPQYEATGQKLASELKTLQARSTEGFDPNEYKWIMDRRPDALKRKALTSFNDTSGGVLLGYPTLGELIDVQRNVEVFVSAGASEVTLPANAMIDFPKLMNGSTAFWVGEGNPFTQSQQTTGNLKLVGKKLGVFVPINNDLLRYTSPTTEGMVRNDMAAVAARAIDLAMLQGTGGTQPLGILNYATTASWTYGTDKALAYTVTANLFQPQDVYSMIGILPDICQTNPLNFIMRNDLWGKVRGRRSGSGFSAADGQGPFTFNIARDMSTHVTPALDGYPVITSSQMSNTRGGGSQTAVILGSFQDWLIARFGVMELLASNTSDNAMVNDQTFLRAIQIMDAGARHPASFVIADAINVA